jgi:hypothetical protein
MVVLTVVQGDRLDSPAGVIRSLRQADPFPCSVTSLGHTDLFKALEPPACAEDPMATRHLIRAPGKREASASPQPLTTSIQPRSHGYRIYPDNLHLVRPPKYPPLPPTTTYGFTQTHPGKHLSILQSALLQSPLHYDLRKAAPAHPPVWLHRVSHVEVWLLNPQPLSLSLSILPPKSRLDALLTGSCLWSL